MRPKEVYRLFSQPRRFGRQVLFLSTSVLSILIWQSGCGPQQAVEDDPGIREKNSIPARGSLHVDTSRFDYVGIANLINGSIGPSVGARHVSHVVVSHTPSNLYPGLDPHANALIKAIYNDLSPRYNVMGPEDFWHSEALWCWPFCIFSVSGREHGGGPGLAKHELFHVLSADVFSRTGGGNLARHMRPNTFNSDGNFQEACADAYGQVNYYGRAGSFAQLKQTIGEPPWAGANLYPNARPAGQGFDLINAACLFHTDALAELKSRLGNQFYSLFPPHSHKGVYVPTAEQVYASAHAPADGQSGDSGNTGGSGANQQPPQDQNCSNTPTCSATIVTGGLNLRSGPSTAYGIIGSMRVGDTISVHAKKTDGWWQVKTASGICGWAAHFTGRIQG